MGDVSKEIEVTPEMIRAGAEIISAAAKDIQDGWQAADEIAAAVWRAMVQSSESSRRKRA